MCLSFFERSIAFILLVNPNPSLVIYNHGSSIVDEEVAQKVWCRYPNCEPDAEAGAEYEKRRSESEGHRPYPVAGRNGEWDEL